MAQIFQFQPRRQSDIPQVIKTLAEESEGTKSFMYLIERADGSVSFAVEGGFADRAQFAAYMLVKMLDAITTKIGESDEMGNTRLPPFKQDIPRRPLPRGLKGGG